MVARHRLLALCASALLVAGTPASTAGQEAATEDDVKAAFVYNFGKFVQWPDEAFAAAPELSLCLLGSDPLEEALLRVVGDKRIQGKPVRVKRVQTAAEASACHILFISAAEAARAPTLVKALDEAPVLTVSDTAGFTSRGGAIDLFVEQRRVRFNVNLKATERAGLRVSSQLLRVAKTVRS